MPYNYQSVKQIDKPFFFITIFITFTFSMSDSVPETFLKTVTVIFQDMILNAIIQSLVH